MMEVAAETNFVPHHKQKLVLILSAMRHFAAELRGKGLRVHYIELDDPENTGDFTGEVSRAVERLKPKRIVVTEPSEWRVQEVVEGWRDAFDGRVEVLPDDRFFASHARFKAWAKDRKSWTMEHFYREMRAEHDVLMKGDEPAGGRWNFDAENRKRLPAKTIPPKRKRFQPDETTRAVIEMIEERFSGNFGGLEDFGWPVTRDAALEALGDFIKNCLPTFGDYQDAMKAGAPFLYHSLIAPLINIGLLSPHEVCRAAEGAYLEGNAPLNAAEGFIRQILGWREYVRGVYWSLMPDYAGLNALNASRPLPWFYWSGETDMRCMADAIESTRRHAYSHHIQRLMLTGNFALLAGVAPAEIERWYLAVYADAFEWVEMPNTLGMAVFADGGRMASKPYAASGAYINRMSDFCKDCAFDVKQKTGPDACPFNAMYWAFLIRNAGILKANPRLTMPYRNLDRWSDEKRQEYLDSAEAFLASL
jgi:deoxyribodipyrimidine photolyase-related protein